MSESALLPSPRGGAESLDGSVLSSFSGLRDVGSPSCGVGLEEFMASCVFGLSSVPRTVLEWGFDKPIVFVFVIEVACVVILVIGRGVIYRDTVGDWMFRHETCGCNHLMTAFKCVPR